MVGHDVSEKKLSGLFALGAGNVKCSIAFQVPFAKLDEGTGK
jgi:hypothetical protein